MDSAAELKTALLRLLRDAFPALMAPRGVVRARVVKAYTAGGGMSELEPRYSVDVQPLTRDGADDPAWPVIPDVPLPVLWGGKARGVFCVPAARTIVRLGWEYGDQNRPYVESVCGDGAEAPAHPDGGFLVRSGSTRVEVMPDGSAEICTAKASISVGAGGSVTVSADGQVAVNGSQVVLCGGGGGVVRGPLKCPVTGLDHAGQSGKVVAA
jgi:hypothetical protein